MNGAALLVSFALFCVAMGSVYVATRSADAAEKSADAAQKSAEAAERAAVASEQYTEIEAARRRDELTAAQRDRIALATAQVNVEWSQATNTGGSVILKVSNAGPAIARDIRLDSTQFDRCRVFDKSVFAIDQLERGESRASRVVFPWGGPTAFTVLTLWVDGTGDRDQVFTLQRTV